MQKSEKRRNKRKTVIGKKLGSDEIEPMPGLKL